MKHYRTNRDKKGPPEPHLSYKLIKRRYKLKDENFSNWFNYASAASFRRSPNIHLYLSKMVELIYSLYVNEGKAAAVARASKLIWPAEAKPGRQRDYKDGLVLFLSKIDKLEREGLTRNPTPGRVKE